VELFNVRSCGSRSNDSVFGVQPSAVFFCWLFRQTFNDCLLPPGVFRTLSLKYIRASSTCAGCIRQLSDDTFKQAKPLPRFALTLNKLRELEQSGPGIGLSSSARLQQRAASSSFPSSRSSQPSRDSP